MTIHMGDSYVFHRPAASVLTYHSKWTMFDEGWLYGYWPYLPDSNFDTWWMFSSRKLER